MMDIPPPGENKSALPSERSEAPLLPPPLHKILEVEEATHNRTPFTLPGLMYRFYYDAIMEDWGGEASQATIEITAASVTLDSIRRLHASTTNHGDILNSRAAVLSAFKEHSQDTSRSVVSYLANEEVDSFRSLEEHFKSLLLAVTMGNRGGLKRALNTERGVLEALSANTTTNVFLTDHLKRVVSVLFQAANNPSTARNQLRKLITAINEGEYNDLIEASQFNPVEIMTVSSEVLAKSEKEQRLNFKILPPGTNLEKISRTIFTESTDSEKTHVDLRRVALLAQIRELIGEDKCYFARGERSNRTFAMENGERINEDYIVLVMQHHDTKGEVTGEDALAISPIARKHAAYLVRHDTSAGSWREILQFSKNDARELGARRIKFTSSADRDAYDLMQEKVLSLLTCDPDQFSGELKRSSNGYRLAYQRTLGSQAISKAATPPGSNTLQ